MIEPKRSKLIKVLEGIIEGLKDDNDYFAPYLNLEGLDGCKRGILNQSRRNIIVIDIELETK
jgi:hypothetical protein